MPVLGQVLKHLPRRVLRHLLGRPECLVPEHMLEHMPEHILEHMPAHMLRNMPDKHLLEHVSRHVPKHVFNLMAHAVLMT